MSEDNGAKAAQSIRDRERFEIAKKIAGKELPVIFYQMDAIFYPLDEAGNVRMNAGIALTGDWVIYPEIPESGANVFCVREPHNALTLLKAAVPVSLTGSESKKGLLVIADQEIYLGHGRTNGNTLDEVYLRAKEVVQQRVQKNVEANNRKMGWVIRLIPYALTLPDYVVCAFLAASKSEA